MISHALRCLFVHIPKTGGTSIKQQLVGYDLQQKWQPDPQSLALLYCHRSLVQMRALLPGPALSGPDAYFQFSFVRNPWDRLLSTFFYMSAGGSGRVPGLATVARFRVFGGDFRRFVLEGLVPMLDLVPELRAQHEWTHAGPDGAAPLDFIGRFERLEADVQRVSHHLGLPPQSPLPHLRRSQHRPYAAYYDAETQARVATVYARDIELFGYQFGD